MPHEAVTTGQATAKDAGPAIHGGPVPAGSYVALGLIAALVVFAAAATILRLFDWDRAARAERRKFDRRRIEALGIGIAAIAFFAGVARAIVVPVEPGSTLTPNLDLVTLTWFGIAAVGALLPVVPQITVGEVTVKLQEAEDLIDRAFNEFRDWGDCLAEYLADIAELRDSDAIDARLRQFINLRLVEAGEWLAISDENLRISVWLEDEDREELVFAYSKEIRDQATITTPFKLDEGLMGAAYTEREIRNEINPQQHPLFKPIAGGSFYGSLLIVPIDYGVDGQLGVLCIDRRPARYFTEAQINVMNFIAGLIGIAIGRSLEVAGSGA